MTEPNDRPIVTGSPASDKALIVSVGQDAYVAMDKGSITDDHMLVIPTNHYPNTLRMPTTCVTRPSEHTNTSNGCLL